MANILCVYYSRTGRTAKLVGEIAQRLECEIVRLEDNVDRKGLSGWFLSGLQAVSRKVPPVKQPETKLKLKEYDMIILATPVWAGRCSAPMRSFLQQFGGELKCVSYVITRSCNVRYEEVFEQMDQYVRKPHQYAVTIRPDSIGSDFWFEEFLKAIRGERGEEDAGQAEDGC